MEGFEWPKVKYTHSGNNLNINLSINNDNQDCKIGTYVGGEGTSGRREGEGRILR
jgi:hypothetical protein